MTLTTRPYLAVIQRSVFRDEGSLFDFSFLPQPSIVPPLVYARQAPEVRHARTPTRIGAIYYGSTAPAMLEANDNLAAQGIAELVEIQKRVVRIA